VLALALYPQIVLDSSSRDVRMALYPAAGDAHIQIDAPESQK
jgi:hypothetical protein